eukprot:gene22743-29908_t
MGLASRPSLRLFSAAKPAAVLNTSSRSSFVLTRRNRAGLPSITAAALPEAVSSGVDTAAAELILRSASHGFTSSADAHSMSTLFHSLNHAIGTSHALHSQASDGLVAFSDLASTVDHQSLAQEAWSHAGGPGLPIISACLCLNNFAGSSATMSDSAIHTAALASSSIDSTLTDLLAWANKLKPPPHPCPLLIPLLTAPIPCTPAGLNDFAGSSATMSDSAIHTAALASSSIDSTPTDLLAWASLKDFAGSTATMADSAIYTAALASSSVDSTLTNLLAWANERIAVVASIDPQSYISMDGSLNELVDGLKQSLGSETSTLAAGYTNALVLGVQSHPQFLTPPHTLAV